MELTDAPAGARTDQPPGRPLPRTVYRLEFDDGDLAGQTVRARSASAAGWIDIAHVGPRPALEEESTGPEVADQVYRLFRVCGGSLLSWTLLDDETGDPIPATLDGLLSLDFGHAVQVTYAWLDAVQAEIQTERSRAATEAELQLPVQAL